jgi:ribose transport system ATP-binding protein
MGSTGGLATATGASEAPKENGRTGTNSPLVSVEGLSKTFGHTKALVGVDFTVREGEIVGLLGANGAGKSTLLNIIGGTTRPTSGTLRIAGRTAAPGAYNGLAARRNGIQRVFQELSTFTNLSVVENFAMTAPRGSRASKREMRKEAASRLSEVFPGNEIAVDSEVGSLSIAQRQMVEIARAGTESSVRLLILDEPTSALSSGEAEELGEFLRRRAADGLGVIYVTHKLDEALELADRIVILRDGQLHWEGEGGAATRQELLSLLGASVDDEEIPLVGSVAGGECVLSVRDLTVGGLRDVSLNVHRGEIVGLAGLEGAGQRELLRWIFSQAGHRGDRRRALAAGRAAYVSGDRQREGLLPLWDVEGNVSITAASELQRAGFVRRRPLRQRATAWLADLGLAQRASSPVLELSGGNQQRVLVGRALASDAPLLLLDDPTRGVDVGAKRDVYEILNRLRGEGRSAIFYSTENAEFLTCDRVYVMSRGSIVTELPGAQATEERLLKASYADPTTPGVDASDDMVGRTEDRSQARKAIAMLQHPTFPAVALFVVMLLLVFSIQPNTLIPTSMNMLLKTSIAIAFASLGQMLFILGGDIDLGLGFMIGLVNVIGATLLLDSPLVALVVLAALVGAYVLMAVVVERIGVPSVVVTLGASFVWLGLGLLIQKSPGGAAPDWLRATSRFMPLGIPGSVVFLVLAAILGLLVVRGWSFGVVLRALGNSARNLEALGYSALRARMTLYGLAAVFAIIAGLFVTANAGTSDINASNPMTLSSVAAAIVGGASFAGGRVSPVGAVLGAAGLALINSTLVFLGVGSQFSTAVGGIVLIVILALRTAVGRDRSRS